MCISDNFRCYLPRRAKSKKKIRDKITLEKDEMKKNLTRDTRCSIKIFTWNVKLKYVLFFFLLCSTKIYLHAEWKPHYSSITQSRSGLVRVWERFFYLIRSRSLSIGAFNLFIWHDMGYYSSFFPIEIALISRVQSPLHKYSHCWGWLIDDEMC